MWEATQRNPITEMFYPSDSKLFSREMGFMLLFDGRRTIFQFPTVNMPTSLVSHALNILLFNTFTHDWMTQNSVHVENTCKHAWSTLRDGASVSS